MIQEIKIGKEKVQSKTQENTRNRNRYGNSQTKMQEV